MFIKSIIINKNSDHMKANLLCVLFCIIIGCNQKSNESITLPLATESWENLAGKYIKKPVAIRINRGCKDVVGHPSLNHQIAVHVPLRNPLESGLPNEQEEIVLEQVEDILIEKLVRSALAVFAVVVTTDGSSDYFFYTGNAKTVKNLLPEIKETIKDYSIDVTVKRDAKWITYTWFSTWK